MARMRSLVGIATAIALVVTCGILAWQLSIEKTRNRQQVQLLRTKDGQIAEIVRARARLEMEVNSRSGKTTAPPSNVTPQPSATAQSQQIPEQARLRWNLPKARAMRHAETKLRYWHSHTALVGKLGLSATEANRFIDLLVSQAERVQDEWDQNPLPNDRASREQALRAIDQWQDAEVEAFLGPEKFRTYHEYQRTLVARSQVNQLGGELGSLGLPLDSGQRETLITMMTEESERTPPPEPSGAEETLDAFKRRLDSMDDYDRRVRERAADTLSSQQLKYLSDEQKLREDMRHKALEMQEQARRAGLSTGSFFWYPPD
jgi:hypothetical protein